MQANTKCNHNQSLLLFYQILFAAADSAMLEFWHIPEEAAKGRDTICLQAGTSNLTELIVDGCW